MNFMKYVNYSTSAELLIQAAYWSVAFWVHSGTPSLQAQFMASERDKMAKWGSDADSSNPR